MGDKGLGAEMNAGKINPNVTQPQTTKANNRAKVVLSSVAGSAIGIAGAVAGVYAMAKKGNPAATLKNLKYAEKDVVLLATGSVLGGLAGGLIADKNKENVKPKLREATQQLVGSTFFPVATLTVGMDLLERTKFQLPKFKSTSKPAKVANALLGVLPRVVVTLVSLFGGAHLGNKVVNDFNNFVFKENVKHDVKPEDMLVHADDLCLAGSMVLKDVKNLSNLVCSALPATFLVSGIKTGIQQKQPDKEISANQEIHS